MKQTKIRLGPEDTIRLSPEEMGYLLGLISRDEPIVGSYQDKLYDRLAWLAHDGG